MARYLSWVFCRINAGEMIHGNRIKSFGSKFFPSGIHESIWKLHEILGGQIAKDT